MDEQNPLEENIAGNDAGLAPVDVQTGEGEIEERLQKGFEMLAGGDDSVETAGAAGSDNN